MSKVSAMSTDTVSTSLPVRTSKQSDIHPLAPINAEEIQNTVAIIRSQWPTDTDLHFKALTLQEPAKAEAVVYIEAEFHGNNLPQIDRRVFVTYYLRQTVCRIDTRAGQRKTNERVRTNSTKRSSILRTRVLNTMFVWARTFMLLSMVKKSWTSNRSQSRTKV